MTEESKMIIARFNAVEKKLSWLHYICYSHHTAMMKYLKDKGIADPDEFEKYIDETMEEILRLDNGVEFWRIRGFYENKEH